MDELSVIKVSLWTCEEVAMWLRSCNLELFVELFCHEHKIDGKALLMLTEVDLRRPPLVIPALGDIKRLMLSINRLRRHENLNSIERKFKRVRSYNDIELHCDICDSHMFDNINEEAKHSRSIELDKYDYPGVYNPDCIKRHCDDSYEIDSIKFTSKFHYDSEEDDVSSAEANQSFPSEPFKTLLSFIYVFIVFWITALVMVIVHDRVPDMEKYPPLPDMFLDNMPYVPWAFKCCEIIAIILGVLWIMILLFHKHRFILLRRMFCLTGTVFMLRSVSMLITSLSVPGVHLNCQVKENDDIWSKLNRALVIWRGFGMSLSGVRTCGDYMFSGHTVIITLLNFFITEYTPRVHMYFLHTITWVLNLFGIFFILAAHEHYSIDVFIAFYITSRLFLYYHTLANNLTSITDRKRTRIWFPLFSFFESRCSGIVPNEYESPITLPRQFVCIFSIYSKFTSKPPDKIT